MLGLAVIQQRLQPRKSKPGARRGQKFSPRHPGEPGVYNSEFTSVILPLVGRVVPAPTLGRCGCGDLIGPAPRTQLLGAEPILVSSQHPISLASRRLGASSTATRPGRPSAAAVTGPLHELLVPCLWRLREPSKELSAWPSSSI